MPEYDIGVFYNFRKYKKGRTNMTKLKKQEQQIKLPCGKYPITYSEFLTMYTDAPDKKIGNMAYYFTSGHHYDSDINQIDLVTYKKRKKELFLFIEELEDSERSALECCSKVQACINKGNLEKYYKHIINNFGIPYETIKDYKIIPGIIVFEGSRPSKEFKDKSNKKLQKLVENLNLRVIHANWDRYFQKNEIIGGHRDTKKEFLNKLDASLYGENNIPIKDYLDYFARTKDTDEYYQELFIGEFYKLHDRITEFFDRIGGVRLDVERKNSNERIDYTHKLFKNNLLSKTLGNIIKIIGKPENSLKTCTWDIPFVTYNKSSNEVFFVSIIYRSTHVSSLWFLYSFYDCWKNINQEELIKNLVKDGKIPNADVKIQPAVIVDSEVYPGIELQDKSRKQLQKVIKELGIKVIYV